MNCCPFLTGAAGHPPYLIIAFVIFCIIGIVLTIKKLDAIMKLLEKK